MKQDKKYAKDIEHDKKILSKMFIVVEKFISGLSIVCLTGSGSKIILDMIVKIKAAIHEADIACKEL